MEEETFVVEVTMCTLDIEMDEDTLAFLDYLVEETGFSRDKVVEYSLANMFIRQAAEKYHTKGK